MTTVTAPATLRTVPPSLSFVNTLFRVSTRGARFAAYLARRTGGRQGWQAKLVRDSGVKRQTITKYTRQDFDGYPEMGTLALIAQALDVRPFEIIAAIDGDEPVVALDAQAREAVRAEIEAILDERLGPR